MKLLTKDNEIVEGREVTEGEAKIITDINSGATGVTMYSHQKKELIKYMLDNFHLTVKPKIEYVAPVEDEIEPIIYPAPNSLPLVEDPEDGPSF